MSVVAVFMALLGLAIGSFVTVLAYRVPRGEAPWTGRSRCPSCGNQVRAYDNIPVVSWILLRGRCRDCSQSISLTYPMAELSLAGLFVASYLVFEEDAAQVALACAFATALVTITLTDLEHRIIPNVVLIAAAAAGAAIAFPADPDAIVERLIAAGGAFAFLFLVAIVYPRGMGMGDVKLAAVMGLYLGRAVAPALLIGFAAGAIVGAALIARRGIEARKQAVPFGPFLALGGLVGLFVGDEIVDWYLDSFFSS